MEDQWFEEEMEMVDEKVWFHKNPITHLFRATIFLHKWLKMDFTFEVINKQNPNLVKHGWDKKI
jgi:hypothetical protein